MLTADTTAADLLAYVVTHPEETDCRLVYADLLEERGEDARAELIRLQCELAAKWASVDTRTHGGVDPRFGDAVECDCRVCTLHRRERELLYATRPGQWSHFPEALWDVATWEFRRGFVEQVTLTAEAFAGGPCGRCGGERFVREPRPEPFEGPYAPGALREPTARCLDCRGTGRTPGHAAAALFRAAPILSVTLSGRAPARERHGIHCWTDGGSLWRDDSPDVLPGDLFRLLPAAEGGWVWGTTAGERDALAALSAACLLYGRRAAWPCESCAGTGTAREYFAAGGETVEPYERCAACAGTGHAVTVTPAPAAAP